MSTKGNVLFSILDHATPKVKEGEAAYTLNSRDSQGAQVVVYNGSSITCPTNASNPKPGDACHTLTDDDRNYVVLENHPADSRVRISEDGIFQTLSCRMGTGGGNVPMVMKKQEPILLESNQNHATIQTEGVSTTLSASMGMGGGYVPMVTQGINGEISGTLDSNYYKGCGERQGTERDVVCVGNGQLDQLKPSEMVGALNCMHDQQAVMEQSNLVVRRLTPTECALLQGFPADWMDIGEWVDSKGKVHKEADAPKYKAAGNSIALPFWEWLAKRICAELKGEITMASLFDGIGGFPLSFSRAGAKPVWSSEIEEFPMAVTKKHFGEE